MLMADSDYIVAALPYTPATHKLVSAEAINSMKKTGVFINVGRGQNVDEPALVQGEHRAKLQALLPGKVSVNEGPVYAPSETLKGLITSVVLETHCEAK